MKIYTELECLNEIVADQPFDFGIVAAGESKKYLYHIVNDSKCHLREIKFKFSHPEVFILNSPKEMLPESKAILEVEWRPSVEIEESLQADILIEASKITTRKSNG